MKSLMQVTDDLILEATTILREPSVGMLENDSSRLEKQIIEEAEQADLELSKETIRVAHSREMTVLDNSTKPSSMQAL